MQISHVTQTSYPQSIHYEDDLYDLDIKFKTVDLTINENDDASFFPISCFTVCSCICG